MSIKNIFAIRKFLVSTSKKTSKPLCHILWASLMVLFLKTKIQQILFFILISMPKPSPISPWHSAMAVQKTLRFKKNQAICGYCCSNR